MLDALIHWRPVSDPGPAARTGQCHENKKQGVQQRRGRCNVARPGKLCRVGSRNFGGKERSDHLVSCFFGVFHPTPSLILASSASFPSASPWQLHGAPSPIAGQGEGEQQCLGRCAAADEGSQLAIGWWGLHLLLHLPASRPRQDFKQDQVGSNQQTFHACLLSLLHCFIYDAGRDG